MKSLTINVHRLQQPNRIPTFSWIAWADGWEESLMAGGSSKQEAINHVKKLVARYVGLKFKQAEQLEDREIKIIEC